MKIYRLLKQCSGNLINNLIGAFANIGDVLLEVDLGIPLLLVIVAMFLYLFVTSPLLAMLVFALILVGFLE